MLKLKAKLIKVNYEKIADRFLPDLFKNITEDSKLSTKIANELLVKNKVTNGIAKGIIKLMPQKAKASITLDIITRNLDEITESINQFFESNQITIRIIDIKIKEGSEAVHDMIKLEVTLDKIDYNSVFATILPKMLTSMSTKNDKNGELAQLLLGMEEIPVRMLTASLDVLPQEEKDDLLVKILSIYKVDILSFLNQVLSEQQIAADISAINLVNVQH
jgi:hypothetical protein